jgi:type I restriction enzyme M protein
MAIKKSELYSSLWKSCDELRGGMDASQYKDYILDLLFIKYVSDKYQDDDKAMIVVPKGKSFTEDELAESRKNSKLLKDALKEILKGGSFTDMVALKNKAYIGEGINIIFGNFQQANPDITKGISFADFNDEDKLGKGKDMTDRLTKLVGIFQNPALDFSKNRAEGDDILGDAYEYLMRHFATESGKSKGQFYTPSEVSRVMAKIISADENIRQSQSVYDPTCGSGSLLLKVADEANYNISIFGQENDNATASLAKMNMILHNVIDAEIVQDNTISKPAFKKSSDKIKNDDDAILEQFDFVVANPPFSSKAWSTGIKPEEDVYNRFAYGVPPEKNGDYAFLLHILASLKSTGKGAVILPHGVLFRGNAEAEIRKKLIQRGYIKAIIGFPANLFYGTGIPACIILLDKEHAGIRKEIFFIDASKGYIKDGNKNRLREQDIHRIVDVFRKQTPIAKFSRLVPVSEIEGNDFNLNIPRYIDNQESEDIQSIEAHLMGGIPNDDIDNLEHYWVVYPNLKNALFKPLRKGFAQLTMEAEAVKSVIFEHPEFLSYAHTLNTVLSNWLDKQTVTLKNIAVKDKPKELIQLLSEDILHTFTDKQLIDRYDIFQILMDYWGDVMQDDVYTIVVDGWVADRDLAPQYLVVNRYFQTEKKAIEDLETLRDSIISEREAFEEEHSGDEGILESYKNDKGVINKKEVERKVKELKKETEKPKFDAKKSSDLVEELAILTAYHGFVENEVKTKKDLKEAHADLTKKIDAKYLTLTVSEIKTLVVDDKWMTTLRQLITTEMENISQRLALRVRELAERYDTPLPKLNTLVDDVEEKVFAHLKKMSIAWN